MITPAWEIGLRRRLNKDFKSQNYIVNITDDQSQSMSKAQLIEYRVQLERDARLLIKTKLTQFEETIVPDNTRTDNRESSSKSD